jgi:hypothetical protein
MNLHAIDFATDALVLGLELGVAQSNSWGRIIEFDLQTFSPSTHVYDLGLPRLFDLCVLPNKKVLVSQHFPAPAGTILVYDYPPTTRQKKLSGFHFPNKLLFHPSWPFVICADRVGLHRVPLAEFV